MTDLAVPLSSLPDRRIAAGTAASLLLHGLLLAGLLLLSPLRPLVLPPPRPVSVEIVTERQFDALSKPPPVATPAPAEPELSRPAPVETPTPANPVASSPPATDSPVPAPPTTHVATTFYAARILSEPGMARIRRTFGTLASSEQLVQLCSIEGLEQVRRAAPQYDPDTLVGYAMADMQTTDLTLKATGGAFRSDRKWYGISFECTVAPGNSAVTAFSFTLGSAIPKAEWEEHNLNAEDEEE